MDAVRSQASATTTLYAACGQGAFAGLLAAGISHLTWQAAALPVMAVVYAFSLALLRGWKELAGVLGMSTAFVVYFAVHDLVTTADLGFWGTVLVICAAAVLYVPVVMVIAAAVGTVRRRALAVDDRVAAEAGGKPPRPAEDVDVWEARYHARLRAWRDRRWLFAAALARPYAWIAAMFAVALLVDSRTIEAVAMCVALFQVIVAGRQFTYAHRLGRLGAAESLVWDPRPPVLFLRSFSLDTLPASALDGRGLASYLNFFSWLDKRTFEECLAEDFEEVGPVVAIGRPGETVAPLGAAREYVADDEWQDRVLQRADAAQCVLMLVDDSPGMTWELEHVSGLVGLPRVVFVLPPGDGGELEEAATAQWDARWAALRGRFTFLPAVTSSTAAVLYDDAGHPVLVEAPRSLPDRVSAVRQAWERQRGAVEPGPDGDAAKEAAKEAMEVVDTAIRATFAGLGATLPLASGLATRRRPAVATRDVSSALTQVHRALAVVESRLGAGHALSGGLHLLLGRLRHHVGDLAGASEEYRTAVTTLEARLGARRPVVAYAHGLLAAVLRDTGQLPEARLHYRSALEATAAGMSGEVLAVERALAFPDLDLTPGGPAEAWLHAGLARTFQDLGDLPGAQVEYGIALPVLDAVPRYAAARLHSIQLGLMHNSYGLLRYTLGDPAGAKVEHEQALDLLVPVLGEDHGLVAATRNNVGRALKALGDLPAARIEYERATSVLDTTLGKAGATLADVDVGRVHANLGTLLRELGHRGDARTELEHAIAIMEAAVGPDDVRLGAPHCTLATVLGELGEHDAACREAGRAVAISEAAHGIDHPEARLFRANLATLERERGVP